MASSNKIYGQGSVALIRMHLDQINTRMFWEPTKFNLLSSRNPAHYIDAEMEKEQLITGLIMICSASGQKRKSKLKDFQVHREKSTAFSLIG